MLFNCASAVAQGAAVWGPSKSLLWWYVTSVSTVEFWTHVTTGRYPLETLNITKDLSYLLQCCEVADVHSQALRINYELSLSATTSAVWETVYRQKRLYVALQTSNGHLPMASKQGFVTMLEFAEEELGCSEIIVCIPKANAERAALMKTFMFLGFSVLPPSHEFVAPSTDKIFMCYSFD
ncbi:unnamed protein product [Notodromas monacha]|uniref:Ornithine decarboxylase antizyme n=1 Tax=Notodromas monacha TaxID=399045 RepID=A0A7R9BII4_9CRUS|nr:unnamed protein product [Notodromas monacha]CAG0915850.1 unnamed protein product [Notodromas monacha]